MKVDLIIAIGVVVAVTVSFALAIASVFVTLHFLVKLR